MTNIQQTEWAKGGSILLENQHQTKMPPLTTPVNKLLEVQTGGIRQEK